MIDYEEARERARQATEPGWNVGTYCLDDRFIVENDHVFVFEIGAREHLVDGDVSYAVPGGVPVVRKADGEVGVMPSVKVATDPTMRRRPNPAPTLIV